MVDMRRSESLTMVENISINTFPFNHAGKVPKLIQRDALSNRGGTKHQEEDNNEPDSVSTHRFEVFPHSCLRRVSRTPTDA